MEIAGSVKNDIELIDKIVRSLDKTDKREIALIAELLKAKAMLLEAGMPREVSGNLYMPKVPDPDK